MHPVLHLKTNGAVAQQDQTLKQRLGKARASSLFIHDYRPKLLRAKSDQGMYEWIKRPLTW